MGARSAGCQPELEEVPFVPGSVVVTAAIDRALEFAKTVDRAGRISNSFLISFSRWCIWDAIDLLLDISVLRKAN